MKKIISLLTTILILCTGGATYADDVPLTSETKIDASNVADYTNDRIFLAADNVSLLIETDLTLYNGISNCYNNVNYANGYIEITKNSTLTINSYKSYMGVELRLALHTLVIDSGSTLQITNKSTGWVDHAIYMNNDATTVSLGGTLNMDNKTSFTLSAGTFNILSGANITLPQLLINNTGYLDVANNATGKISSVKIDKTSIAGEGEEQKTPKIYSNNADFFASSEFKTVQGTSTSASILTWDISEANTLSTLGKLIISDYFQLNINLSESGVCINNLAIGTYNATDATDENKGTISFTNFQNDTVKFNLDNIAELSVVENSETDTLCAKISGKNYYIDFETDIAQLETGYWTITNDGYLNYITSVPEPATFALIFAVVALAYTLRRSRK